MLERRTAWLPAIAVSLVLRPCSSVAARETSSRRAEEPRSLNWVLPAVGAAALLSLVDEPIRNGLQKSRGHDLQQRPGQGFGARDGAVDLAGRYPGPLAVSGAFYIGGLLANSEKQRRAGVLVMEAFVANVIITDAVKFAVGRSRPYASASAFRFEPFSDLRLSDSPGTGDSFPSGHASTAFSAAAVVAEHYDSAWIDFLAYGAAATVGFARAYQNAHWASDVAGGAVLGIAVGKGLCLLEGKRGWSRRLYAARNGAFFEQRF